MSADDAKSLIAQGWQKLKEWIADEVSKHVQNKPELPKTNWAIGSMQWQEEQEKGERTISQLLRPQRNRDYPGAHAIFSAQLFYDILTCWHEY